MKRFIQNDKLRRVFYFALLFNFTGVTASVVLFWFEMFFVSLLVLLILVVADLLIYYFSMRMIYNELYKLSSIVSKASNDNFEFENQNYSEGLLSGLQHQFGLLFSRISRTNQQVLEEREKMGELVTELSHQIKTPVSSIKLFNELLNAEDSDSEILYKMNKEILKLEWLTKILLDISKLETGLIKLQRENYSVVQLINDSISTVYPKSMRKNILINVCDGPGFDLFVDNKWTIEAIVNILDNAIKYSDDFGKVEISFNQNPTSKRIQIKDSGRGIDKEDIPKIFNRFFKGKNTSTEEGTGIGLYLANEIMQMQGGYIKVNSVINEGSMFEIVFYD